MKRTLLSALPFVLALSACTKSDSNSVAKNNSREKIYDGQITSQDSLIAHTTVLILNGDGGLAGCTGSVLSPTIILTASHCVTAFDEKSQTTKMSKLSEIGIYDADKVSKIVFLSREEINKHKLAGAQKTVAHPVYINQADGPTKSFASSGYDMALIQLDKALPESFKPVILPEDFSEISKNKIRVAGFGGHTNDPKLDVVDFKLRDGRVTMDAGLREFKIANPAVAGKDLSMAILNSPESSTLSFKKVSGDSGVCHGDSGGPLYYEKDGEIHLVGVNVAITSKKTCVDEGDSYQFSASLVGPQIRFVLDTYKDLTGKSLPLTKSPAVQDERTFEYQLNAETVKPKNNIASLEGYTWAPDEKGDVMLIDAELAQTACHGGGDPKHVPGLYLYLENRNAQMLDGKTAINILTLNDQTPERILEARMKVSEGGIVRAAILTTEGYISADLPILSCK